MIISLQIILVGLINNKVNLYTAPKSKKLLGAGAKITYLRNLTAYVLSTSRSADVRLLPLS